MIDQYGRCIDYVRVSITDRCNLRCMYCMPAEGITSISHEKMLSYEEILRLLTVMAKSGIKKVKITGGEPLVRKGCASLIRRIKEIKGIEKVTLTTNGVLLKEQMTALYEAGIDAINISLDSLDAEEFCRITRRDQLPQVLEGIHCALQYPQIPLKINCVPIAREEAMLLQIAALAKDNPIHVRFIEVMPIGYGRQYHFRDEAYLIALFEAKFGPMTPCPEHLGNGPCHYYSLKGFQGKIGFISAMTHKFCHQCNRVRLTSEGFLKPCLQYNSGASLRDLVRAGVSDQALQEVIQSVILSKPECHRFHELAVESKEERTMSQIGG